MEIEWSASRPSRFISGKGSLGAHWGDWVGPRIGLDLLETSETSLRLPENRALDRPAHSQVTTNSAIPAAIKKDHLLTYSMEQSPAWEANWFCSWSRNSPHFWNPKVHHHIHKCPPPVPILSQLHTVPTTPSHFLKIHLNIILPY